MIQAKNNTKSIQICKVISKILPVHFYPGRGVHVKQLDAVWFPSLSVLLNMFIDCGEACTTGQN